MDSWRCVDRGQVFAIDNGRRRPSSHSINASIPSLSDIQSSYHWNYFPPQVKTFFFLTAAAALPRSLAPSHQAPTRIVWKTKPQSTPHMRPWITRGENKRAAKIEAGGVEIGIRPPSMGSIRGENCRRSRFREAFTWRIFNRSQLMV